MREGIEGLLGYLRSTGGSDLHLTTGMEPRVRLHGALQAIPNTGVLDERGVVALLRPIISDSAWTEFERMHDVDVAYALDGVGRFRVNLFRQIKGTGAVFRIIPESITPLEDLNLPHALGSLAHMERGLVLVTGPTGSGKSTTLAGIVDAINRNHRRHVVTIEDPIEFVHQPQKSIFSHREVGLHTATFTAGLRAAIRQDADVVLVGEMREAETIGLALEAAEMGMLVFGTLHTNSAAKTIDRLIDAFPAEEQPQIRNTLSGVLSAVVAQLLLPTADGLGRIAAVELLMRTPGLPNIIREGRLQMIETIIQSGRAQGMQSLDDALFQLVKDGKVDGTEAWRKARDKSRFDALLGT